MLECANAKYFDKSPLSARTPLGALSEFDDSLLRARGFDEYGYRSGGIAAPAQVIVPPGALLIRTYVGDGDIGQWWFTVYEFRKMLEYAGHTNLTEGRNEGKGMLHAFLAILVSEWGNTCECFVIAALSRPLYAFYGEGDHATRGSAGGQKAALMLSEGRQHAMRQVFLPQLGSYPSAMTCRIPRGNVDRELVEACRRLPGRPLPFEVM